MVRNYRETKNAPGQEYNAGNDLADKENHGSVSLILRCISLRSEYLKTDRYKENRHQR